jgi:hypothetical protein
MFAKCLGTEVPTSSISGGAERFFYSVTCDPAKGEAYLKFVNASSVAQPVKIKITGANSIENTAALVTISGNSLAETNTIAAPSRIVPLETTLKAVGPEFVRGAGRMLPTNLPKPTLISAVACSQHSENWSSTLSTAAHRARG